MPIPRTASQLKNWIPRDAEQVFINLLGQRKACVLPLVGVGGAGKSSLLQRFFNHCKDNNIPALHLNLPNLTVANMLEVLLQVQVLHAPAFDKQRKMLNASYETLTAMLESQGGQSASAAELLRKNLGNDESLGIVVDALKGAAKVVHTFWQRDENQRHKALLLKPEETLIRALAEDFKAQGVILVDTLEQAGRQGLQTHLVFRDDGELETPATNTTRTQNLLDYCGGMAHFLFDKPILMVLAGRPPAVRELGGLGQSFFEPTVEVPAFTAEEVRTYLENSLPRHVASPQDSDISQLQRLTHGNPFLLERVVRLLSDWSPRWDWQAEQWQPLFKSFEQDERHGLLLFATQRLLTHTLPDDRAFWRLALPRKAIHRSMAELLFPKSEFTSLSGLQRINAYTEKGIIFLTQQDPDQYFLHDETRAALEAWAKRENCWLDAAASAIHSRLATWFKTQCNWPDAYPNPEERSQLNGNPLSQEGAYHELLSDDGFESRYPGHNRSNFWLDLASSISLTNAEKMRVASHIPNLSGNQIFEISAVFSDENNVFGNVFKPETQAWLKAQSAQGLLSSNWAEDATFLRNALSHFPSDQELIALTVSLFQPDEALSVFEKAIEADPKHAPILGDFALFMGTVRQDHDRAQALYEQAIEADPKHANNLGNYAQLLLMCGNLTLGGDILTLAFDLEPKESELKLELWFYRLAHFPKTYSKAEAEILALLETGARSVGWDFSGNIKQAATEGHPNVALLQTLADAIASENSSRS